jgi:hypothetical protein
MNGLAGKLGIVWIFSSGLYLTQLLPVSPVQIVFVAISALALIKIRASRKPVVGWISIFSFYSVVISLVYFLFSPYAAVLNLMVALMAPLLVSLLLQGTEIELSRINLFLFFYAALFLFDGFWRLMHPADMDVEKLAALGVPFHIYKVNSIMYLDSNFVGIHALSILSFGFWLRYVGVRVSSAAMILCTLGLLLTLSRAAYVGAVLCIVIWGLLHFRVPKFLIYFGVSIVASICLIWVWFAFSTDVSFLSKFHIFKLSSDYLARASVEQLLLGVGLTNAEFHIGVGAHNLFVAFLIELGLIGLGLLVALHLLWLFYLRESMLILSLPYLLASMSLGTSAFSYYSTLVTLAMMIRIGSTYVTTAYP